jgi:hypothetical protein
MKRTRFIVACAVVGLAVSGVAVVARPPSSGGSPASANHTAAGRGVPEQRQTVPARTPTPRRQPADATADLAGAGYGDAVPLDAPVEGLDAEAWVAQEEAASAAAGRSASAALRPLDPGELGFPDEQALHATVRRRLGIPADRTFQVMRGEREGREVVSIVVEPKSHPRDEAPVPDRGH